MAYTRVKICGITRPDDVRAVADSGADAMGLVFYPSSPRAVSIAVAEKLIAVAPPLLTVVALFVDAGEETVAEVVTELPVDVLQFHGEETRAYCEAFGRPYLKALRMAEGIDLESRCADYLSARGILLDSWQPGVPGGTGQRFDWNRVVAGLPRPLLLAGGLDADSVPDAIRRVAPAAVDVSGGVESAPGVKDPRRISEFVAAVRRTDSEQLEA